MEKLIKVDPKEYGVEEVQANELTKGLKTILQERELLIGEFEQVKDLEITKENLKVFRELRIKFQKNRAQGINDWHKKAKDVALRTGQLLDAIKRNESQVNESKEEFLERAEKHFENLEKQRIADLQTSREAELAPYGVENVGLLSLGLMSDDIWKNFLTGTIANYKAKKEAEEAAEKARQEEVRLDKIEQERRIAIAPYAQFVGERALNLREMQDIDFNSLIKELDIARAKYELEQEKIREENERLKKEAEEKETQREAERKEAEQKAAKERAEAEAKLKEEIEKASKLAAEIEAKRKKEEAERKAQELAEKKAKAAPDKEKLEALAKSIEAITLPELKTNEAKDIAKDVQSLLGKVVIFINQKTSNL